jgi:hypothetical protein
MTLQMFLERKLFECGYADSIAWSVLYNGIYAYQEMTIVEMAAWATRHMPNNDRQDWNAKRDRKVYSEFLQFVGI